VADDGVADVQFRDFRDRGNRLHVGVVQAVAGVDLQPFAHAVQHAAVDALQFGGCSAPSVSA
jgi:hypothetical protein